MPYLDTDVHSWFMNETVIFFWKKIWLYHQKNTKPNPKPKIFNYIVIPWKSFILPPLLTGHVYRGV